MKLRIARFPTGLLLALCMLTGCTQKLYWTHDDMGAQSVRNLIPGNLETDSNVMAPRSDYHAKPPNINDVDREKRYMTLQEAMAIALESGTRGTQAVNSLSNILGGPTGLIGTGRIPFVDDTSTIGFFGGILSNPDDAIRAFALDPATIGTNIEGALSKFDARWTTSATWTKTDNEVASTLTNLTNGDSAAFSTGIYKPMPTGGLAGITFNTNYIKYSAPPSTFGVVNPAYTPSLQFTFEQPLLKGFGVAINQLTPAHPGSITVPNFQATGGTAEGILITRIRFDQARADFERNVNLMLFNIETAYWILYEQYFALYAADQGVRQSFMTWQLTKTKFDVGTATVQEVAQVRAVFENFRSQRLNSLANVQEAERQFRGLLGLPVEDGKRIVPADAPTMAAYEPDYSLSVNEAFANRPELLLLRDDIKARQMDVLNQQNSMRPDLRFISQYNVNSIGTSLNGSGINSANTGNAFANLADNKFNTWTVGINMQVPLGFRLANAATRQSELGLARAYINLRNQETKTERLIAGIYQALHRYYGDIQAQRERRKALAQQLEGLFTRIKVGRDPLITILQAQSDFASALQLEYAAIGNYNIALAAFHYAKGTIRQYNNVQIAEGDLPACTLARATDFFAQRSAGLVLREREQLPLADEPNPLPRLLEHEPPTPNKLPDGPDMLLPPGQMPPKFYYQSAPAPATNPGALPTNLP
jgi:outer membrane protein TolC